MSVAYLLLGEPDADQGFDPYVKGIVTPDRFHVFEIYDFLQTILIDNRNRTGIKKLWNDICKQNAQFMYVQGTLDLLSPSSKMRKTEPKKGASPGTTVAGLQAVLHVLGRNHVTDANRKVLEDIFARYHAGDRSMIVEIDLNSKVHPQVKRFNYNFQPPSISHAPVASVVVEEAGAAEPGPSSRESSGSMEFDFTSTEDHIVRNGV
jgi:hypothetical protein